MKNANPPVIFTAFANPHHDLVNLTREQNGIQDALRTLDVNGTIKHVLRTDTDLRAYFDFLQGWKNRIRIFHYAGHADGEGLGLQNAHTFFEPLAKELIGRNRESLTLVFLNGCSTYAHVQTLFDLGAPAVIATAAQVDDSLAGELAVRFYDNLAKGDAIAEAYRSAANYIKGANQESRFRSLGEVQTWRTIAPRGQEMQSQFPWSLFVREENILQGQGLLPDDKKTGNDDDMWTRGVKNNTGKIYNIGHIDNANFS